MGVSSYKALKNRDDLVGKLRKESLRNLLGDGLIIPYLCAWGCKPINGSQEMNDCQPPG